jgi:hypothetical protein
LWTILIPEAGFAGVLGDLGGLKLTLSKRHEFLKWRMNKEKFMLKKYDRNT